MAEAHSAVAFQFTVTDEGILFHIDRSALQASLKTLFRLFRNRYYNIRRSILTGIFPATPLSLLVVTGGIIGIYATGFDPLFGLGNLSSRIPKALDIPLSIWNYGLLITQSVILWTILCYVQRYTLRFLLLYASKGWMFDPRGRPSYKTKVFSVLVKLVAGTSHPLLTSYQQSLPLLPLPSIKDTCTKYLASVRPLCDDKEFEEKKRLVEHFRCGPANKLQRYLVLKTWMSSNYVTDWWEKYVYNSWRGSIMINSNYYASDFLGKLINPRQIPRAALYIHAAMIMKEEIEQGTLKPLIINNLIPLCSAQYKRLFGTCRIPGEHEDTLACASPEESRHVVCYREGRWYKVQAYHKNKLLNPAEIEYQLQQIINDPDTQITPEEEHLAALTSAERPFWAEVRSKYFSTGVNRTYMEAIEKAAFFLNLDPQDAGVSLCGENKCEKLTEYCKGLLHGNGYKFWFDKSFSAVMYRDGRIGINAEHSWADAPIVGHMLEYSSNRETDDMYNEDHSCVGEIKNALKPLRMKWEISKDCKEKINIAYNNAQIAIDDIDLYVNQHDRFGKGVIKRCGISPDAFVQMALQLAYYRDAGKFCLSYESSMTRLYLEGRTETVRPCTVESANFVLAMCDPNTTKEERKRLLKIATDNHVLAYKNAMIGKGIDRHLFCLYVVSKGKNIPSPFLTSVIKEPWKLSTSQTPTQQTGRIDYNNHPDKMTSGGGFGAVAADGYGVSYIIPGDYLFYFHVSSFKSSPHTDSHRFSRHIETSLQDMISLFDITLTPEDGFQYECS